MDVDADVDGKLAQQLECLGTSDRDMLVQRFADIVGRHVITPEVCRILLDMNNWNLQRAVGCFYDYRMADQISVPSMNFIKDVTIGEGESVPPNTTFVKVWRICNSGSQRWPAGCRLHFVGGERLTDVAWVDVEPLEPGCACDVSISMVSPPRNGLYNSSWQMRTEAGYPFGEIIWCIIAVEDSGLLGLTQMMAQTSCGDTEMGEAGGLTTSQRRNYFAEPTPSPVSSSELLLHDDSQFPQVPRMISMPGENAEATHTVPFHSMCGTSYCFSATSTPINIPAEESAEELEYPVVPPCTPSSADESNMSQYPVDPTAVQDTLRQSRVEEFE